MDAQVLTDDQALLDRMFRECDLLENEVFRRVYGISSDKQLALYRKQEGTKVLPEGVRSFCLQELGRRK
jgi:hypothetical protein